MRRIGAHADAVTEHLVRDLKLTEVELDEFWSFVGKKGTRNASGVKRTS
jgi:hypothetical protein